MVILDGIASISEDGIASLSVLLGAANANFYIARVPERVLPQVKQAAERHEAPIISVLTQRGASEHFEVTYTNVAENEVSGISELVRASLAMPTPEHIARFMNSRLEKTTNGGTRSSPPPPPGASVGKYELLEHIASGGMAQVYLARQRGVADFQKIVAVKRILPHLARTQRFVDMFAQEARLAAKIRHPNVVDIYELEQDDTSLFIAMEYIDGIDARTLMTYHQRRQIHIPMDIALGIVRDVASGLHAAHTAVDETGQALGIVHRDVSPRNILLSVNGAVKLTDFGIAKAYSVVSATAPGMVKGKLPYLAPEQLVAGGPAPGPVSDVFAAGVVLFELLAGVHPFAARTKYEIMKSIVESDRPRVGATRPDVPAVVEAIVQSAIATQPSDRYASAAMLRDALDQAIEKLGLGYTPMRVAAIAELASVQDPNAGDEGSVSESEVDNQPTETYHGAKD